MPLGQGVSRWLGFGFVFPTLGLAPIFWLI
jgi:hypothetical protein